MEPTESHGPSLTDRLALQDIDEAANSGDLPGDFPGGPWSPPAAQGALGACRAGCAHRTCWAWRTGDAGIAFIALCPRPDLKAPEALQARKTNRSRPS